MWSLLDSYTTWGTAIALLYIAVPFVVYMAWITFLADMVDAFRHPHRSTKPAETLEHWRKRTGRPPAD